MSRRGGIPAVHGREEVNPVVDPAVVVRDPVLGAQLVPLVPAVRR